MGMIYINFKMQVSLGKYGIEKEKGAAIAISIHFCFYLKREQYEYDKNLIIGYVMCRWVSIIFV